MVRYINLKKFIKKNAAVQMLGQAPILSTILSHSLLQNLLTGLHSCMQAQSITTTLMCPSQMQHQVIFPGETGATSCGHLNFTGMALCLLTICPLKRDVLLHPIQ